MADDVNINVEENINPQDIQAPVDVNVEPTEVTDNGIGIGNISNNSFDSNMFAESGNMQMSKPDQLPQINFQDAVPDMNGFDVQTFSDAVEFATEGMPNLEMNQPFIDMIDAAAVDLDKYSLPMPSSDMNSIYPGTASTRFNPFNENTGRINLNSRNGRRNLMSQTQGITNQLFPNQTPGYRDPFVFGQKKFEMDRYYHHPRFADLGFHPFANNEELYNNQSSKWDNFTRTRGQWSATFGPAFTSGWRSIGDMFTGDTFAGDMIGAEAMTDAMRIGRSGSGGTRGFFNDLFLNSSYTMGIISSIALEELVLWGVAAAQGGLNPASDALAVTRTAANLNRLRKLFSGKTYVNAAENLMQTLKSIDSAKKFFTVARSGAYGLGKGLGNFFMPETLHQFKRLKTSAKAGENLTNMAKATSMFGGFYMDFRNANLAWSESKMEGGIEELEMRDELYSMMKEAKGGVEPTAEELEMNGGLARAAGLRTTLINAPIIFLSNKLVLGHALRGFKRMGRFMDNALDTAAGRIRRSPKGVKEGFYDLGEEWLFGETFRRMYKAGMKGSMKHLGASALKYSTMNLAEGFQELAQEATAKGVSDYYKGLYEQALAGATDVQIADMVDSYNAGKKSMFGDFRTVENMKDSDRIMESVKKGIASQMSGQGVHTFLSGFMMGGLIQGPQKVMFQTLPNVFNRAKMGRDAYAEYKAAKEQTIKRTVEVLNEVYADPAKYFDPKKVNMLLQKELNSRMIGDSYADNIHEFINNRDHSIFSHLYTVMQSGQIGEFKDMIKSFTKLDNKGIKEAFKGVDSSPQKLRNRAQAMLDKAEEMENAYKEINENYVNPFDPKKYKKGTRKHHEEVIRSIAYDQAKMMMMFAKDTFESSLKRSNEIMESFASDPILASISAADISALTSYSGLIKEIDLLKQEVNVKATTKEEKKIIEQKKKKLKLLQDYYDVFTAKENQTSKGGLVVRDKEGNIIKEGGTFDKRKINKLKPAFEAYLKFIAEQNDDYVMPDKLMSTLKKIVDLGYLKGRAQDNFKAMEILMNPDHLVQLAERMALTMEATWNEYRKQTNLYLKVKKYYDQKERTEFIKALADKGIYPDPDQVKLFLEEGTMPVDFYDKEGKITPQSDPTAWQIIEGLQQTYRQTQAQTEAETAEDDRSGTELEEQLPDDSGKDIIAPKQDDDDPMSKLAEQQAGRVAALQAFLDQDENTRKILQEKYDQYKVDNLSSEDSLMTYPQWLRSKNGGAGILRSRYELSKMYEAQSQEVKSEKTFDQWIDSNSKNPLLVGSNGILTKNNVTISDVSITKAQKEGIKEDKLQANETPVSTDKKTGINVIETTVTNPNDGTTEKYYTVVDNNNVNAADKYKGLDPSGNYIKKVYPSKAEALKAAKFIKNNMPKKSTFSFGGLEISTGDIVEDGAGKKYVVRSTSNTLKNNGNLWVIPVSKQNLKKGEDGREYLTEENWKDQGWKKALPDKADLSADNLTRITTYEPVKFYPFDSRKVDERSKLGYLKKGANTSDAEVQENWQKFLRDLTPLEMLNLNLVVEKNPDYDIVQKEISEGNFRPYRVNPGREANPGLAAGANELEVTVMVGNRPVGKLVGLGVTILRDTDGSIIDGTQITQEQAERLFITQNDPLAAAKIRKRYAYAQLVNRDLKAKLGGNQSGTFKLSDFPSIKFAISAGNIAFPDKGTMDTPWQDLQYSTMNGKIMIADIRTVYRDGKAYTQVRWDSDIDRTTKSGQQEFQDNINEINAAIGNTTKKGKQLTDVSQLDMGRYVQAIKLPNGTITFVELKSEQLEKEEVNDILFGEEGLLNQQKKTLVENFKDGKLKPDTDGFDPLQFNKEFNADFNEKFYISLKPGEHLSFNVTPYGKIAVNYTDRLNGVEYTVFLNDDVMEKVDSVDKFVATVIANFNADQKSKKAQDKNHKIVKLDGFTADSFVNNIPKTITAEALTGVVSARIKPEIRTNLQAQFVYTNSADVQSITNNKFSTKGMESEDMMENEQTPEEVILTDELFKELVETDFAKVPDSIVKNIKSKILAQEKLTEQERMIVDALAEQDINLTEESDVSTRDAATSKNEDGNQAESNNESIIALINKKKEQLKKEEKDFVARTRVQLEADGLKGAELNKELRKRKREDQDLIKLREEIEDLQNNKLGYKILDNFDGHDVENINRFIEWAKENLPSFIQIADIEALGARLKNNGMTAGAFAIELSKIAGGLDLVGKIYVGENNPFKYHEAFHAVFRMLLSEAEITKYLRIARREKLAELKKEGKTLRQALDELQMQSPLYQKMSQQELEDTLFEEYLADKFEEFKKNPGKTNTSSEVKSIFTRILEWIKSVFLNYSPNELNILFDNIDTGKYKSSTIANNRFTTDLVNLSEVESTTGFVSSVAFKIKKGDPVIAWRPAIVDGVLKEKGKKVYVNKYFSQQEQNTIVATVGAMFLNKVREVAESQAFEGQYNPDVLLREAIDDYIEMYNPEREDNLYLDREDFMEIEDELTDYFEGLSSGFNDIKRAVEEYLTLFDVKVQDQLEDFEQVDFTADGIVKAADQWDSEVNQIGGFKSLSAEIRKFIATTTVKTEDQFGNEIDQPVDYAEAYNGLLKAMKNTKDPYALLYKMEMFALRNENTAAVVDRIMDEIGLSLGTNELLNRDYNINDASNKLFLQSIIKGFTQFRVDYIFAENDPKRGVTNLYAANHKDDAHTQTDRWASNYGTKFERLSKDPKAKQTALGVLDTLMQNLMMGAKGSISDKVLDKRATNIAIDLENTLGISLSTNYIKFSILSAIENPTNAQAKFIETFSESEPITSDDVQEIMYSVESHNFTDGKYGANLFLNVNDSVSDNDVAEDDAGNLDPEIGDVKNRIKKFARGNAIFDETVGNTVFLDPKGNLIYAHQQPTFHLEKVAELNSEEAISALKDSGGFYDKNYLLNNPKFMALASQGKLRISRVIGQKLVKLETTEEGDWKTGKGLDLSNTPGKSFGEGSPAEFIANLINVYLVDYNAKTGKVKTTSYTTEDEFGKKIDQDFASALVDIKVIAESNTGDFISLPIVRAVEKVKGKVQLRDTYVDNILNEVETEYNRIKREVNQEEGYTEDIIDNYNDFNSIDDINDDNPTKSKAAKLFKTGELVVKRIKPIQRKRKIEAPYLGKAERDNIVNGRSKLIFRDGSYAADLGIKAGDSVVIELEGIEYLMTNRGVQRMEDLTWDDLKVDLGSDVSTEKSIDLKYKVKIGNEDFYVRTKKIQEFLKNKTSQNLVEIELVTDEVTVMEDSGEVVSYSTDSTAKTELEKAARQGVPFDVAVAELKKDGIDVRSLIEERLYQEFDEFKVILTDIKAIGKIDKQITGQLQLTSGKKDTPQLRESMGLLNLLPNEADHNLMQWFFNDFLNTMSINQILLGDVAMTVKDAVDEVKRAKMQNAAGPSAESIISAPEYGVMHPVSKISAVTFRDPQYQKKTSEGTGDKTDAQMYMTTKAFRYMMFGFGSLNAAQAKLLDKVERGEEISAEEFFGNAEIGTKGFKDLNAILNSKKLVYGDGKTFIKMSAFVLTPALTTNPLTGEALPNREKLHNMRIKLEQMEARGKETIGIAVPETASKMMRANVIDSVDMFNTNPINDNNVTSLEARWMRMQQFVPSNKLEIVDPTQIKTLITSEQSDSVKVSLGGVEMTVGDVRRLYNKTVGDRVVQKYLNQRNLMFTFANAQNELQRSIDANKVSVDLQAFIDYAKDGLQASGAKSQFLEIFETDRTGSPKYDLNNPITIQKFQELFMTFFSRGIISEKQPGHSLALVSDQGMKVIKRVVELDSETGQPIRWDIIRTKDWVNLNNPPEIKFTDFTPGTNREFTGIQVGDVYIDDLRSNVMEYDKDGKPTGNRYSEFMLPPHFAEIIENLKPGQPIPDVISKAFGTRIPSQDKHSAVNLKAVDFLPVEYGSVGVFPEELIEISGADFDIDKLYMQVKEFYMKDGEFIEYGKTENEAQQYEEYLDYQRKQIDKPGSTLNRAYKKWSKRGRRLNEVDEKVEVIKSSDEIEAEWAAWSANRNNVDKTESNKTFRSFDELGDLNILGSKLAFAKEKGYHVNVKSERFSPIYKRESVISDRELLGTLRMIDLPVTLEEFAQYVNRFDRLPYTAAQDNVILDARFSLLGNEGMTGPLFGRDLSISEEPAVLDPLLETWDFIQNELPGLAEKVKEEGVLVDNALGKLKAWTNNKAGANSIGAVVLPNTVLNLLKENNIQLRNKNASGEKIVEININGHNYNSFGVNYEIDPKTGNQKKDGLRTQFVISALVTAMTDNAKERLAAKLGLTRGSLSVVTNLVGLGVGIRTAIMLVNHPSIKEAYFLAENKEKEFDPGVKKLISFRIEDLARVSAEAAKNAQVTAVTDNMLIDQIKKDRQEQSIQDITDEIAVLNLFQEALYVSDYTFKMQSLVTLTAGLGRDIAAIAKKDKDIFDLGMELTTDQMKKDKKIPFDSRKIFRGSESFYADYYDVFKEVRDLLPSVFITQTEAFNKLYGLVLDNLDGKKLSDKTISRIQKDILSYITGKAYVRSLEQSGQSQLLASLDNGIIYDEFAQKDMSINDIVIRLRKYLEGQGKENYFIQKIVFNKSTKNGTNKSGINLAEMNTWTKLSDGQLVDIQNSFLDLYQDVNTRADAIHLLHYLIVKDGLQYAPNTFLGVIPAPLLEQVLSSVGRAHDLFKKKNATDSNFVDVFGVSFNEMAQQLTEGYLTSRANAYYMKKMKGAPSKVKKEGETIEGQTAKEGVSVATKNYKENTPDENPSATYVFTENINSLEEESTRKGAGQAVIRGKSNALGLVTKKRYVYKEDRPNLEEGEGWNLDFQDNNTDFEMFIRINRNQLDILE